MKTQFHSNSIYATATFLALITAVISGVANFTNKFALSSFADPVLFTTLKNSIVAILLIGIFILVGRWTELKHLSGSQWVRLGSIGLIGGALPFALFFTGLAQTSAVNGSLIHKTLFLFVALLAIPFLGEKMKWQQWLGIAIIFAANFVVGGFTGFKFNSGELMILGATILWAIENVIAKKALVGISSLTVSGARMVIGSVLLISYSVMSSGLHSSISSVSTLSVTQWAWTILTALLLAGYVLTWYSALSRAPATYVATILVPATLVTNILSAIFITHAFTIVNFASALLYVTGLALVILYFKQTITESTSFTGNSFVHHSLSRPSSHRVDTKTINHNSHSGKI